MKKILLFTITGMTLIFTSVCNNPDTTDATEKNGGEEKIKINAAVPVITGHPQGAEYYVDAHAADLTVTVSTSDGGTLSYQWYNNTRNNTQAGTKIVGADSAKFSPPTNESTLTYYYVIVTNTIEDNGDGGNKTATAVSKTAGIAVNEKTNVVVPGINSQPQGAVYTENTQAVNLTIAASTSDEGTLSYRWYSNTNNNNTTGMLIQDAKEAYYKPSTSTLGIMYYYVIVTNTISDNGDGGKKIATKVSATAKIEVNDKINAEVPIITEHPKEGIYSAGSSVMLTVTAFPPSDGGILSYQWYYNTIKSSEAGTLIPGATDTNYRPSTAVAGELYYYVIVTNTIPDNGDGGNKTAPMISNIAEVALN
jgi:quinol monooxygenase YgiN